MLKVKLLDLNAMLPTVASAGVDLAYDVRAMEDTLLVPGTATKVRTGIAVELEGYGFEFGDRSSMAAKGVRHSGGKIDAGYRGELLVVLTYDLPFFKALIAAIKRLFGKKTGYRISAGDKIIQMLPRKPETAFPVVQVDELSTTVRGEAGFGSTGR